MAPDFNARVVRLAAASAAGEASARLRLAGERCNDYSRAEHCGAYQWAKAAGFYDDEGERGVFTLAFLSTLDSGAHGIGKLEGGV